MIDLRNWLPRRWRTPEAERDHPTPLPADLDAGLTQYAAVSEHISKLDILRAELGQLILEAHGLLPAIRAVQVHARYDEDAKPLPPVTRMNPHPLWQLPIRELLERGWTFDTLDVLEHELKRRKVPADAIAQLARFE
jgi:hypothetical protein